MFKQFSLTALDGWQLELINKYPLIYLEEDRENKIWYSNGSTFINKGDYCNLRFGFEFNSGWKNLADEFSQIGENLVKNLRQSELQPDAYIHGCIFKEKFGCLEWQGNSNLIEPFRTLWMSYEFFIKGKSAHTCERTGKYGKIRNINGWLSALCDEEYQKECESRGVKPESK